MCVDTEFNFISFSYATQYSFLIFFFNFKCKIYFTQIVQNHITGHVWPIDQFADASSRGHGLDMCVILVLVD